MVFLSSRQPDKLPQQRPPQVTCKDPIVIPPYRAGQRVQFTDLPDEILQPIVRECVEIDPEASPWSFCLEENKVDQKHTLRRVDDANPRSAMFLLCRKTCDLATEELSKSFSGRLTVVARKSLTSHPAVEARLLKFCHLVTTLKIPQARSKSELTWHMGLFETIQLVDFSTVFPQHRPKSHPIKDHFTFERIIRGTHDQELADLLGEDVKVLAKTGGWNLWRSEKRVRIEASIVIDLGKELSNVHRYRNLQGNLLKIIVSVSPGGQASIVKKFWCRSAEWKDLLGAREYDTYLEGDPWSHDPGPGLLSLPANNLEPRWLRMNWK